MTEFANFWKNYINFSDRTTRKGYWMAILFLMILVIVVSIIGNITTEFITYIFQLAVFLPGLAIMVRRYRDAGKRWFFMFIPIYNIIILFLPSVPDDGTPVV